MNHNKTLLFSSQRNFTSSLSSLTSSLSSSTNQHGPSSSSSMFSIGRLRLALYFICILAITTSLYCLVSYKPDGIQSSAFNSHPILLSSSSQILDEVIVNTNKYYLDFFRYRTISTVPPDLSVSLLKSSQNELSKLIYIIDNLTQSNQEENFENLHYLYSNTMKNRNKFLQERDNVEYNIDDFDEDPTSVEYHLLHLGFDLQHIIYLYALSHQDKVSPIDKKSFQPLRPLSNTKASYHQRYTQLQLNLSSLLPNEFLTSIIFLTAINSNQFHLGMEFIKSFEDFRNWFSKDQTEFSNYNYVPNFVLMIYDLGLYPEQLNKIEKLCNKTSNRNKSCEIRTFQYDIYPSHISDLRMAAYRSIILQEMLRDIRFTIKYRDHLNNKSKQKKEKNNPFIGQNVTLFWLDPQYRFINAKHHIVLKLQNETLHQSGILSWPIEQPTSTLTHPRMFEYFHTTKENFYFHRMVRPGHLMISISDQTWEPFQWGIMLPWVRCALTSNCIAPLGSQWRSSCRLDKKPHYRYSGCHHYDMSALNVVLGIAFNYSSSQYSAHLSRSFFTPFNKPLSLDNENEMDTSFEYQFEDESKVPGRFDLVLNDNDIPDVKPSQNFLFSLTSSPSSFAESK